MLTVNTKITQKVHNFLFKNCIQQQDYEEELVKIWTLSIRVLIKYCYTHVS